MDGDGGRPAKGLIMTKKKVKAVRYLVLRTFSKTPKGKHQAGTVITKADIPGLSIDRLIERGVIALDE